MPFRFVHTADLHLDSPLKSLALRDSELADAVGTASREALAGIVRTCLDERVDALMIAGDLFDGERNTAQTANFLQGELRKLSEAGIETFIVRGNHDAGTAFGRGVDLPDGVHVFDGRGTPAVSARNANVSVHGVSFRAAHAPKSLLPTYARPEGDGFHVGLMHTSLAGAEGHDSYAPCRLADLVEHGFQYWGLGHVHGRSVHHEADGCAVVMSGMPQGRDMGEAGAKSATLVTLGDDGSVAIEEVPTALVEFARVEVALDAPMGWDAALAAVESAMMEASSRIAAPRVAVRLRLTGESRHHYRLLNDEDLFADELTDMLRRDDPNGRSGMFVEKVEMRVAAPAIAPERKAANDSPTVAGALAELRGAMGEVAGEGEFRDLARERMAQLRKLIPARTGNLRDQTFGADEVEGEERLDAIIERGLALVAARLEGAERGRAETDAEGTRR